MKSIINAVRSQEESVWKAKLAYIENMYANESIISTECQGKIGYLRADVQKPKKFENGNRLLVLKVWARREVTLFGGHRETRSQMTWWNVFSLYEKLVEHHVGGRLHVAAAITKRGANVVTNGWDGQVDYLTIKYMANETMGRVEQEDPAKSD